MAKRRGMLFLVVGPSGVGKDSLIDGARRRLADDQSYHFATRVITRPDHAVGEDHQAVTEAAFERLESAGGFMLSWRAHGQRYGIPRSAEQALANGRSVIVNVSRHIIDRARRRWAPVRVLLVSAPMPALRARLTARGRETDVDIEQRLEQARAHHVSGDDVLEVVNDDALEDAIDRFVMLIETENGRSG